MKIRGNTVATPINPEMFRGESDNVLCVTYDNVGQVLHSTYAEIEEAFNNGYAIFMKLASSGLILPLLFCGGGEAEFANFYPPTGKYNRVAVTQKGVICELNITFVPENMGDVLPAAEGVSF